jgi:hypothetical protein
MYLQPLHRFSKLPETVDPSAPNLDMKIDRNGYSPPPAHPEVFASMAPLPRGVEIEPLLNVHKMRLIAGVVKSLVLAQHPASRIRYDLDRRLLSKCLRLKSVEPETLARILASTA